MLIFLLCTYIALSLPSLGAKAIQQLVKTTPPPTPIRPLSRMPSNQPSTNLLEDLTSKVPFARCVTTTDSVNIVRSLVHAQFVCMSFQVKNWEDLTRQDLLDLLSCVDQHKAKEADDKETPPTTVEQKSPVNKPRWILAMALCWIILPQLSYLIWQTGSRLLLGLLAGSDNDKVSALFACYIEH